MMLDHRFFRLVGAMLLLAFGSMHLILRLQQAVVDQKARELNAHGTIVFASLDRSGKTPAVGAAHYYFGYSGHLGGIKFARTETVSEKQFYVLSEGKNVRVKAFRDDSGEIYARLDRNEGAPAVPTPRLARLAFYSLALSMIGLAFFVFSYPLARIGFMRS